MGYDILGKKTKDSETIVHVSCNYSWQPEFKKYLGFDIKDLDGRITKQNKDETVINIEKIIKGISNCDNPMNFRGSLNNCSNLELIDEFRQLRDEINVRNIRYLIIG